MTVYVECNISYQNAIKIIKQSNIMCQISQLRYGKSFFLVTLEELIDFLHMI